MKIKIKNVRLAFSQNLFVPGTVNGEGEPAYSITSILGPNHPDLKVINAAIQQVGQEKWKDKWPAVKTELTKKDKLCLHDGDDKASYDGFPGNLFIPSRSKTRPKVRDSDGVTDVSASDGKVYAGCYVHVILDIWAQDNQFGKRVNATLLGVLFYKDGDAFSGGAAASDEDFEDLSDTGDDLAD